MRPDRLVVALLMVTHVSFLCAGTKKIDLAQGWGVTQEELIDTLWPKAPRPTTVIPRAAKAPAIDGKPGDPCWASATVIDYWVSCKGFGSKPPLRFGIDENIGATEARVCYDDQNLYIYMRCDEEHMGWLQMKVAERDGSTWKDDCIEVFLDRERDRRQAVHVIINPAGAIYDSALIDGKEDRSWNFSGDKIGKHHGEDYWAIEMAFPFASLGGAPKLGERWGFNLCRQRRASGQVAIWAYGTWSGMPFGFGELPKMGDAVFGLGAANADVPGEPFFGRSEFKFTYRNDTDEPMKLQAKVQIDYHDTHDEEKPITLTAKPGEPVQGRVPFTVRHEGMAHATLVLCQEGHAEPLVAQRRGFYIRPISPQLEALIPRAQKLMAKAEEGPFRESVTGYLEQLRALKQEIEAFKQGLIGQPSDLANYAQWLALHRRVQEFAGQAGFVVWSKHPSLPTSPNDFPATMKDVNEIRLRAAQNERVNAALMVTNLTEDPLNILVRARATALVDVLAPFATDMETVVKENPDALGFETVRGFNLPGKVGEPLVSLGQLRELVLMPLSTRQLILAFQTKGLKPGPHYASFELHTLNKAFGKRRVRVKLEVYPFELADDAELGVHAYDYSGQDWQLQDIRAHKVNTLFTADFGKFKLTKDGQFVHDMKRAAQGTKEKLRFGGRAGWAYGLCNSYHQWAQKQGLKPGGEKYDTCFRQAVRSLAEAHREVGFEDGSYLIGVWDEVKGKDVDTCVHLLKLLKEEAPHIRLANTIQCSMAEQKKLFPYIDVWVAAGGYYWNAKWADELRKAGKELWGYTCSTPVRGMNPLGYYRFAGWRAMKARMDGISFFAWSYLVYQFDDEIITNRGWEAWRDGVEDWQVWHTLRKQIARIRKLGREDEAKNAEKLEQELLDKLFKLGTHPKDSPELAEQLEATRHAFAEEIIRLQKIR